jgi:hypothetical protein
MQEEVTLYAKLVAKYVDIGNYITYVFENLYSTEYDNKYLMCVQFPNWNQSTILINDVGYVNVRYVREGISQWYDGEKMQVYKYTNVVFLKFIKETKQIDSNYVID